MKHVFLSVGFFCFAASAVAQAPQGSFCPGDYSVVSGNVTGYSAGKVMELVRIRNEGTARLVASSCTQAALTLQGRSIALTRAPGAAIWSAQTPGGGGMLDLEFSTQSPRNVLSRMTTSDGTLRVNRGSRLTLQNAVGDPILGCDPEDQTPSTAQEAIGADFITASGWKSAEGYEPLDYVRAEVTDLGDAEAGDKASFTVTVPLSLDMAALPALEGDDFLVASCSGKLLVPTRKLLSIKVFPVDPGYSAFARIVDVETSRIEIQAEGQSDGQTPADAVAAMVAAYNGIGAPVTRRAGPFAGE